MSQKGFIQIPILIAIIIGIAIVGSGAGIVRYQHEKEARIVERQAREREERQQEQSDQNVEIDALRKEIEALKEPQKTPMPAPIQRSRQNPTSGFIPDPSPLKQAENPQIKIEKCKVEAGLAAQLSASSEAQKAYDEALSKYLGPTLDADRSNQTFMDSLNSFNWGLSLAQKAADDAYQFTYDSEYNRTYTGIYLSCLDRK